MQRARVLAPHEIAGLPRLVLLVDADGVVRERAAEVAAPLRIGVIGVRARVDQDLALAHVQQELQRIGVSVRGDAQVAERAGVDQHAHLVGCLEGGAQQVVAGFGELHARPVPGSPACLEPRQRAHRACAEQRHGLAVGGARLGGEIGAIEQHGAGGDQRAVRREAGFGREAHDVAVVRVTDHGKQAGDAGHRGEEIDHGLEAPPVRRREVFAASARGEPRQQQEVQHECLVA